MSELTIPKIDVLSLTLDGFEGPIDLLLSLARDHKIDLTKLSILKLAEQYLEFLDDVIKKDIDIAAEYLVMGAWLAFLKSKLLLPEDKIESSQTAEEMSELLEFQIKRLEGIQKVSKLLFKKHQLGTHFFKRGDPEFFNNNNKVNYDAIDYANDMGANLIEIHTGYISKHIEEGNLSVVNKIESLINKANQSNLMVNAGHDLNLINLPHLVKIGGINEVSIGHAIVIDALNYGFEATIKSYIAVSYTHLTLPTKA